MIKKIRVLLFCVLLALARCLSHAQSSEAVISDLVLHKPLFLRGLWAGSKLNFDQSGRFVGGSDLLPFTLSGVDIAKVKLSKNMLTLVGYRVGIAFEKDLPLRATLNERLEVDIEAPSNGLWNDSLSKVFTDDYASIVHQVPSYWRAFVESVFFHLPSTSPDDDLDKLAWTRPATASRRFPGAYRIGNDITPPRLIKQTTLYMTPAVSLLRYSNEVVIALVVNTSGKAEQMQIVHPAGLGMDEEAIRTVSEWVFTPARRNGIPTPFEMRVAVNFQTRR